MMPATELVTPCQARDAALLRALEGVDVLEEDAREHAKRVLLQAQHDADIVRLKEENRELRKMLDETRRRGAISKKTTKDAMKTLETSLTEQLRSNNRLLMGVFLAVVIAAAYQTDAGRQLVVALLQGMMKK